MTYLKVIYKKLQWFTVLILLILIDFIKLDG